MDTMRAILLGILAGIIVGLTVMYGFVNVRRVVRPAPKPTITPVSTPVLTPTPSKRAWIGKISIYSEEGCLGCSATLTMANGERLHNEGLTIAFNRLPMNRLVRLTNVRNGLQVVAKVTDTGGFEKYDRLADLTPAVAAAIGASTDTTDVRIEEL